jgi:DNA-binding IclR family transcriptional regulator
MPDESKQVPEQASPLVEELIVLQVLREDCPDGCSISELHAEIGFEREDITESVDSLAAVGVVVLDGEQVRPTWAAKRIDALGMICI